MFAGLRVEQNLVFGILAEKVLGQAVDVAEDSAHGQVHALDGVGKLDEGVLVRGVLGKLLDVVARGGLVGYPQGAREAVETVADGDVEGFAEDAVAVLGVGDDLGVAAADVEHDRVFGLGDLAAHLDVADAVVDGDERDAPQQGERAGEHGDGVEGRPHAGPAREADHIELTGVAQPGRVERAPRETHHPVAVVAGRVAGQEALTGRRDVRVPDIREDLGVAVVREV